MKKSKSRFKEHIYIFIRKLIAVGNSICFLMCRIFPIKDCKICVCTFEGKGGFGCNPKYIVSKLHEMDPALEFVWLVKDKSHDFPDYIKKASYGIWSRAYHLSTSRIWIDNYRKPYGTIKRRGQYYLNTWHGTAGFKSIGLWRGNAFSRMAYLVSKNDSKMIDAVLSDSKWCDIIFPKGLLYNGPFLKTGSPRCDVLFGDRSEKKRVFYEKFNIPDGQRLVLYAPTYREASNNGVRSVSSEASSLDFDRLIRNLNTVTGDEWRLVRRLHPQLAAELTKSDEVFGNIIEASFEPDMYEVLAAVDMLITDYSSVAMEAGFMEIPVMLYADDLEEYMKKRGGEQWIFNRDTNLPVRSNVEMMPGLELELPFPIALDNDELEQRIMNFDRDTYHNKILDFKRKLELVFDGKASERVSGILLSKIVR